MTLPTMLSIGTPNSFAHFMQKPRVSLPSLPWRVIKTTATRLWHFEHMVMEIHPIRRVAGAFLCNRESITGGYAPGNAEKKSGYFCCRPLIHSLTLSIRNQSESPKKRITADPV